VYQAANHLHASRQYAKKARPLPMLCAVDEGILKGNVPFDKDWMGFSTEEYHEVSESVMKDQEGQCFEYQGSKRLDLEGYQIVCSQFFSSMRNPAMTIDNGKLRFNTACLKKFEDVEYVELLLNSVTKCVAIRPCEKDNPNAIRWGKLSSGVYLQLHVEVLQKPYLICWNGKEGIKYRFRGQYLDNDAEKMRCLN
jgi:site-specific DNA recombinase